MSQPHRPSREPGPQHEQRGLAMSGDPRVSGLDAFWSANLARTVAAMDGATLAREHEQV